ncbi:MAG: DUF1569 domain-containing protein [Acidobacteriaceae bacterium]
MPTLAHPQDSAAIHNRLIQLSKADQPHWGRMNVHQMICHLSDAYLLVLGEKTTSPATGPMQRTLVKWIALKTSLPWPKNVPTRPEFDQLLGGTPPTQFADDMQTLLTNLNRFEQHAGPWPDHPIFGPLTRKEWLLWGYRHADHHLRQFGR